MSSQRLIAYDNICGIMIIYMIFFYHLFYTCSLADTTLFYALRGVFDCFMAWFFYKSGAFYNNKPMLDEVKWRWRRLLVPFLTINVLCFAIPSLNDINDPSKLLSRLVYSFQRESNYYCEALWFLFSLAMVKIAFAFFAKVCGVHKWIICVVSLLLAIGLNYTSYRCTEVIISSVVPSWVGNIFLGLFFYGLGSLTNTLQYKCKLLVIISIAVYLVHLFFPSYLDVRFNKSSCYLLSIIYYICGIIVFNNLFVAFANKDVPILSYVGRNSMIYYITHFTFFRILSLAFGSFSISGWPEFFMAIPVSVLFFFIVDRAFHARRLRWIVGMS